MSKDCGLLRKSNTLGYIVQFFEKHVLLNYRGLSAAKDLERGLKLIMISRN